MRDNNLGMTNMVAPLSLFLFAAAIGAILYLVTEEPLSLILLIIAGSVLPIMIFYRDNIRNPRQIDIQEDGFLAVYRNGKSEFISWERINAISYYPADPTKLGRKNVMSAYQLKGKDIPFMLKDQLGKEMRDAYARKMGKYPPM